VKFIHRNAPESLPKDVALCLFRIAQEALRNVIKHSGALHKYTMMQRLHLKTSAELIQPAIKHHLVSVYP
jgi:signal transduction histidine kinase